jgi:hypothetical protein
VTDYNASRKWYWTSMKNLIIKKSKPGHGGSSSIQCWVRKPRGGATREPADSRTHTASTIDAPTLATTKDGVLLSMNLIMALSICSKIQ